MRKKNGGKNREEKPVQEKQRVETHCRIPSAFFRWELLLFFDFNKLQYNIYILTTREDKIKLEKVEKV